jgi:hypothetical protein
VRLWGLLPVEGGLARDNWICAAWGEWNACGNGCVRNRFVANPLLAEIQNMLKTSIMSDTLADSNPRMAREKTPSTAREQCC